jgi:hypothetical protein
LTQRGYLFPLVFYQNRAMRKNLLLLVLLLAVFKLYSQDYKDIARIEFNTLTRAGISEEIVFKKDSVIFISIDRRTQETKSYSATKIKKKEYKKLISSLKTVTLKDIPALKSPTMKRAYDGANHSEIVIYTKDNTSYIHRFDNEEPHQSLLPLMDIIKLYLKSLKE